MKTKVAVRDKTPHRFEIVPLRDARSRNIPASIVNGTPPLRKAKPGTSGRMISKPYPLEPPGGEHLDRRQNISSLVSLSSFGIVWFINTAQRPAS